MCIRDREKIAKAGAITPLVTLVQSGTDGQKEYAAGALANLAMNAEYQVLIARAGAILPLVTLVQSGTDGQKEQAAGALRRLAMIAENKVLIAQAGAIAPLVTLVQSGTAGQKEHAVGVLRNLALNAENQALIAQAGAIAPARAIKTWFSALIARFRSTPAACSFWPAVPLCTSVTTVSYTHLTLPTIYSV